jgi:hypothetical protein
MTSVPQPSNSNPIQAAVQAQASSIGGQLLQALLPQLEGLLFPSLAALFASLLAKIGGNKGTIIPAPLRPVVDGVPDDKITPAPAKAPPAAAPPPPPANHGYTSLKLSVFKAQYNRELFPDQYDPAKGGDQFGLYHPALQTTYNRRSKIWFDCTPFKGTQAVQQDEGRADGILWTPRFHLTYNGDETIVSADRAHLQDTVNGTQRPIQVVQGDSVGVGFSAWDFAYGFLCQIQVGENEGSYSVWVEIPELGLKSDPITFSVS